MTGFQHRYQLGKARSRMVRKRVVVILRRIRVNQLGAPRRLPYRNEGGWNEAYGLSSCKSSWVEREVRMGLTYNVTVIEF